MVFYAVWERAARVVGVSDAPLFARARKVNNLALATLEKTVAYGSLRAEDIRRVGVEPLKDTIKLEFSEKGSSVPPVWSNDRQDILWTMISGSKEIKTQVRLTKTNATAIATNVIAYDVFLIVKTSGE